MIYRHKKSLRLYRTIHDSFDADKQEKGVVYVCLESGNIFHRSVKSFEEKFQFVRHSQNIEPKVVKNAE